ncbi:hypothetical protein L208DRAFT_1433128 [Tricholoma matsutake]|nr:hypothetical protein L208DRAFT_1433128 [Tricholoma matsutake 945]
MSIENLPDTISFRKGMSMTFLKNDVYLMRTHVTGASDADTVYVPPHWHETHDEIFCIRKGQMEVTMVSSVQLYGPEDGEIRIPKGVVHSLKTYPGVECIFEERTEPMDDSKELFFRNMLARGSPPTNLFELMNIFYHGDARPTFYGNFRWLERAFVTVIGSFIAPLLGYTRKYDTLKKL